MIFIVVEYATGLPLSPSTTSCPVTCESGLTVHDSDTVPLICAEVFLLDDEQAEMLTPDGALPAALIDPAATAGTPWPLEAQPEAAKTGAATDTVASATTPTTTPVFISASILGWSVTD
jgi:hypothetical protein